MRKEEDWSHSGFPCSKWAAAGPQSMSTPPSRERRPQRRWARAREAAAEARVAGAKRRAPWRLITAVAVTRPRRNDAAPQTPISPVRMK